MNKIDAKIKDLLSGKIDYLKLTMTFLITVSVFRVVINALGVVELSGDEAQYWDWSRHMDWCYYSKPPGVAALIWLGTAIFGNNELGVRSAAILCSFVASLAMFGLGKRMFSAKAGAIAAIIFQILPGLTFYGIGLTPDSPLIMFWSLSLYFFYRAVHDEKVKYWFGLTISIGLALLCKYAIIFFFVPAIIYLVFSCEGRKSLRKPWPYLSLPISLLFFAPVIYWNSQNNWVTFRHDMGHTNVAAGWIFRPDYLMQYVGGQLLIITPVAAVLILLLLLRNRKKYFFSFCFTVPILAAFLIKSCQGKIQPNWVATAWLAGVLPLADYFDTGYWQMSQKQKDWSRAALSIPAVAFIIIHVPFVVSLIPWPAGYNPTSKLVGWRQLSAEVDRISGEMDEPFIISDYYMTTAELAFYCEGNPIVYCANLGNRMSQYDIWPGFEGRIGEDAVFVPRGGIRDSLYDAFEKVEVVKFESKDLYGRPLKKYALCKCYNFKGWEIARPDHY